MGKAYLGGQAILEGVLMQFKGRYAVSIKTPKGIDTQVKDMPGANSPWRKIMFLRGIYMMFMMMRLSFREMGRSAEISGEEDEVLTTQEFVWSIVLSIVLALVLFKFLPLFVTSLLVSTTNPILFNIVDGVLRIAAFVMYIALIGRMQDVKRMFQFHAAEHMTINAYESTKKISVKEAAKASRLHPRCSTTFVLLLLIIAIVVFSVVPVDLPLFQLFLLRMLLLLPILGIGYEFIFLAAKHSSNPLFAWIVYPGYWLQLLTTKPPEKEHLEVAVSALKALKKDLGALD